MNWKKKADEFKWIWTKLYCIKWVKVAKNNKFKSEAILTHWVLKLTWVLSITRLNLICLVCAYGGWGMTKWNWTHTAKEILVSLYKCIQCTMVIVWSEEIRSSVFGWHNRDQRKQLWEYPRQPVLLGPMTFTKYGTSSWELRFQSKTQVMLLHGITEKHKKYEVSDSQALFRRTDPRRKLQAFYY